MRGGRAPIAGQPIVSGLAKALNNCYILFNVEVVMVVRTRTSTETEEHIALKRNRLVLEQEGLRQELTELRACPAACRRA